MAQTVLICDDAIFMRTMVGDILQQAGFEVIGEAETGTQAVEKYKLLRPDLVTMDIVMPDMGGIDAVREITKFDPSAKVLMCSAMGQQALVVEAIQAGAKDFVDRLGRIDSRLERQQRAIDHRELFTALGTKQIGVARRVEIHRRGMRIGDGAASRRVSRGRAGRPRAPGSAETA